MKRPRVLFIGMDTDYLMRHFGARLSAIATRYHLEIASPAEPSLMPPSPGETLPDVPRHAFPMRRKGPHPADACTFAALAALIRRARPDLVHVLGAKPIVYGGLVLRALRHPAIVATMPGLGPAFVEKDGGGSARPVLAWLGGAGFRLALRRARARVIFENPDNARLLQRRGCIRPGAARVILGAGVNLETYQPASRPPEGTPLVVLIARLLRTKGVLEFAEAAQRLRESGVTARFAVIGTADAVNPDNLADSELRRLRDEGRVEMWDWRTDVAAILREASIACLPSYYPEGIPRILMEAAACGLPIVTTATPGCREAVANGETGLLVPPRDAPALADALGALLRDPERARAMGRAGRRRAEALFGDERIVAETLAVYRELLEPGGA